MQQRLSILAAFLFLASCVPTTPPATARKATPDAPPLMGQEITTPSNLGAISPQTPSIKVALLLPLSGESQAVGTAMLDAATLAVYDAYLAANPEHIHAQLVLLPKDTGKTPAESVAVAQQAIDQGANFIIGPLFSQSVSALAPIAKAKKVSMLTFSNTKSVASSGIYTFGFMPEQQVLRMAEYAYLHKYQRVALLAPNDAYGEKVRDSLADIYAQKGGIVAPTELYAPSPANIDAAVARLAGAYNNTPEDRRFQALYIADGGAQLRNILKSLKKNNINLQKVKLLGTGSWDDPELAKIPEMQGAWFPSSPPEPYAAFERRFMNSYGYKPARLASLSYDAVTFVAQLAMAGDGKTINDASLADPNGFSGPANGLVRLKMNGINERRLAIMEVTPDGFTVIDQAPKSFSE